MISSEVETLRQALNRGETPPFASVSEFDDPDHVIELALETATGRRWLRGLSDLDRQLADRLLAFESDFRSQRRDGTLQRTVLAASIDALRAHQATILAGPAAADLLTRLAPIPEQLMEAAVSAVSSGDSAAAENTLYLLILDVVDPIALGTERRAAIARAGLAAAEATIRSLAAEYLFDNDVEALAESAEWLVFDSDERVRGLAWSAGYRARPGETFNRATEILGNESADLQSRRSALAAVGTHHQTSDVIGLLAFFVAHPIDQLALDAGNLLYRLHRHPTIATAAAQSPHQSVREIGLLLLDPFRGSPAAGGSRPGDPTTSDIFAQMLRQTESPGPDQESG
jgi:hypothetical protein